METVARDTPSSSAIVWKDRVYVTLGFHAPVTALDAATGKEIWRKNFVQDYGSKIPPWYNGQNPLIEEDRLLVAPAGTAALATSQARVILPVPDPVAAGGAVVMLGGLVFLVGWHVVIIDGSGIKLHILG